MIFRLYFPEPLAFGLQHAAEDLHGNAIGFDQLAALGHDRGDSLLNSLRDQGSGFVGGCAETYVVNREDDILAVESLRQNRSSNADRQAAGCRFRMARP